MNYKVVRVIGVVMLVLGVLVVVMGVVEGGKPIIRSIGAGGTPILIGGLLLGRSFRLENKIKDSGDPSGPPKM